MHVTPRSLLLWMAGASWYEVIHSPHATLAQKGVVTAGALIVAVHMFNRGKRHG